MTRNINARYFTVTTVGTDIVAFTAVEKIFVEIRASTIQRSAARHLNRRTNETGIHTNGMRF